MIKVLIIDDEDSLRRVLKKELQRKGFMTEAIGNAEQALQLLKTYNFDVILLDIVMPGMDGITFLKKIRNDPARPSVIVLTGKATVENAVEAMKNGAFDYISKPYKLDELEIIIHRAYEYKNLQKRSEAFGQELSRKEMPEFVCTSKAMQKIMDLIKKIAPTDSPVLIQGESGVGKEILAKAIWHYSKRKDFPFLALNCATLSEHLLESELFGYEKGAFTNAYQTKYGLVEVAEGGTLFLDEIGEFPLALQAKLLRFLDSGEFRRVGGTKLLHGNVRIIAATNRNLEKMVQQGQFRQDLYYRLNVFNITVPPLRERKEEIPALIDHFLTKFNQKYSKQIKGLSPKALEALLQYHWPGNVRELENIIERAVILSETEIIELETLAIPEPKTNVKDTTSNYSLEQIEKAHILRILKQTNWNKSLASQILGIDRKTLYIKMKKYGISQDSIVE